MNKSTFVASGGRNCRLLICALLLLTPLSILVPEITTDQGGKVHAQEALRKSETHVVEIRQFKFFPAALKVKSGDVIVWKNLDIAPHTATAKNWDSGNLARNESWSLRVSRKGTFEYICAFHPAMKGKIIVG